MERLDSIKPEIIRRGENVTIHALFMRHGEKAHSADSPDTSLTPEGVEKSKEFGRARVGKDAIKAYSSDTDRTIQTSDNIVGEALALNKGTTRLREFLEFHYDGKGNFLKEALEIKKKILGENYENLPEEEKKKLMRSATSAQVDYYLSFGSKRPDPDTFSPEETASDIAKMLSRYIKMPDKLKSDSEIDLVNVTHDFNLASFLKEVMVREVDGKAIKGFDKVEEIGGAPDFNEAFEILIKTDEKGEKKIKLIYRDAEYDIDMQRLQELSMLNNN